MGLLNSRRKNKMGRMYSKGKGIARRCLPYRKAAPSWVRISSNDLVDQIIKLAKKGFTPSQIGVTLRDSHGIPQCKHHGQQNSRNLEEVGSCPQDPRGPLPPDQEGSSDQEASREVPQG